MNHHPSMMINYTSLAINKKLKYNIANTKTHNKHNHKRNTIWFNPPIGRYVSTKISKYFLNLLEKYFPQNHCLHMISNRNRDKVMKTIINNHNKNILGKKP